MKRHQINPDTFNCHACLQRFPIASDPWNTERDEDGNTWLVFETDADRDLSGLDDLQDYTADLIAKRKAREALAPGALLERIQGLEDRLDVLLSRLEQE